MVGSRISWKMLLGQIYEGLCEFNMAQTPCITSLSKNTKRKDLKAPVLNKYLNKLDSTQDRDQSTPRINHRIEVKLRLSQTK